ncbi:hypothetical protein BPOR_0625g00080 [Botrytis porri]|uniref:Uncharacterized protein n=1 Tax=Botrytis porri TaxID=87229 RepID=A0A4Z1KQC3_9HELO|nr:hypothetical protein BPOR_0625g00080 [Botrytis porri]
MITIKIILCTAICTSSVLAQKSASPNRTLWSIELASPVHFQNLMTTKGVISLAPHEATRLCLRSV